MWESGPQASAPRQGRRLPPPSPPAPAAAAPGLGGAPRPALEAGTGPGAAAWLRALPGLSLPRPGPWRRGGGAPVLRGGPAVGGGPGGRQAAHPACPRRAGLLERCLARGLEARLLLGLEYLVF